MDEIKIGDAWFLETLTLVLIKCSNIYAYDGDNDDDDDNDEHDNNIINNNNNNNNNNSKRRKKWKKCKAKSEKVCF